MFFNYVKEKFKGQTSLVIDAEKIFREEHDLLEAGQGLAFNWY
ncbi:11602_t:CDS:1, partial [Ambispora gerdemannii]